jgi:hypothetical protein
VSYLNSPRKGCPRGMTICGLMKSKTTSKKIKWKTTSKKMEDDLKKMEDNLKKNGRQPKKKLIEDDP